MRDGTNQLHLTSIRRKGGLQPCALSMFSYISPQLRHYTDASNARLIAGADDPVFRAKNKTRQATYVWRHMEALSQEHSCLGKAIGITYCVSVALVIQSARRVCLICHLWPVGQYHVSPRYNDKISEKKVIELKMCVLIFSTIFI